MTNVRKVWACIGGVGSQTLRGEGSEEGEEGLGFTVQSGKKKGGERERPGGSRRSDVAGGGEGGGGGLGIHWSPCNTFYENDLGLRV